MTLFFPDPDTHPDVQDKDGVISYNEEGELDMEYVDAKSEKDETTNLSSNKSSSNNINNNNNHHVVHISKAQESGSIIALIS